MDSEQISTAVSSLVQLVEHVAPSTDPVAGELPDTGRWWGVLAACLQQARDEERSAIGREFHDELGQVLAAVQMGVSSLAEQYSDHVHLTGKIAELEELLSGAVQTVQRISSQLWPAILNVLGLAAAIEWYLGEFESNSRIRCFADVRIDDSKISKKMAATIYRIFQECLTNVYRHANATKVSISLKEKAGYLVLVVVDDGNGIALEQIQNTRSMGILGMRQRANFRGGRLRISRIRPHGTVVIARIPLRRSVGDQ